MRCGQSIWVWTLVALASMALALPVSSEASSLSWKARSTAPLDNTAGWEQPLFPARFGRLTGSSVRTAKRIIRGVRTLGNTGTVPYGSGSCGPEEGQFWKARLRSGERVTILWGSRSGTVTGLDVWPPRTRHIHGSDDRRLTYQSIARNPTKLTFVAPRTGIYPIVFDDSCGRPGVFHFILITG